MKTILTAQREVKLNVAKPTRYDILDYVRIDNLQLDISCSNSMLNKCIRVRAYGSNKEMFDFGSITLLNTHRFPVDTDLDSIQGKRWEVKYLDIEPLQKDNWPIFLGINSLNLP